MFHFVPELAIAVGTNEALNFPLSLNLTDDNGQITGPADITGWTWICQARATPLSSTILLTMTVQTVGPGAQGKINIHATATSVLAAGPCAGQYDIVGTPALGEPWAGWTAPFAIIEGVSR